MIVALILIFAGLFLILHDVVASLVLTFLVYLIFGARGREREVLFRYIIFLLLLFIAVKVSIIFAPLILIGIGIYLLTNQNVGGRWKRNFWRW